MADNNNNGLMDRLMALPKWAIFSIGGIIIGIILFLAYLSFFPEKAESKEEETVFIEVPDGEDVKGADDLLTAFDDGKKKYGRKTANDFWGMDEDDAFSAPPSGEVDPFGDSGSGEDSTKSENAKEYSDFEKLLMDQGVRTKDDIDKGHAEKLALAEKQRELERKAAEMAATRVSKANEDSLYYARLERSLQIAQKYSGLPGAGSQEEQVPEKPEDKLRRIDLEAGSESDYGEMSFSTGDGIISSLNGDNVGTGRSTAYRPVKATFLKTEKIISGQRVILRLLDDFQLSNGAVIPANTHITGITDFEGRMKIDVRSLHFGGKMFSVDLSVYDNDGTEGIYCPVIVNNKKGKKKHAAEQTISGVMSGIASTASTFLTGNPFLGMSATSGLNSVTGLLRDDGSIEINISAGYEFYISENREKKK